MEEFNEEELQKLIQEALSEKKSNQHPFGSSAGYLGFAETNLMEILHNRLSKRFIESNVNDIFKDAREEILSRKLSYTIKDLHTITKNCKKCKIDTPAELPKWNVSNPDIAVVIDSPSISQEAISLMVNSFKSANLTSDKLCLTYVNRCPVKRKYEYEEVVNCSPYLHSELQLLNPKLILCLGTTPASVLFGTDIKIKSIRGQILWLGYWPILITFSPNYVLRSNSFEGDSNNTFEQFDNDIKHAGKFVFNNQKSKEEE